MSKYYILSSYLADQNSANLNYTFRPPLELKGKWEVAVCDGHFISSNPNISAGLQNNTFRYSPDNGLNYFTVTLPDGTYTTADINTELHATMKANGHEISADVYGINLTINLYLLRVSVVIDTGYILDLSISDLCFVLGFNQASYTAGTTVAQSNAKIGDPLRYYLIYTDIIEGGAQVSNTITNGIIKAVQNNNGVGVGVSLKEVDYNLLDFYPVKSSVLSTVNIRFLDINGRILDFRGESTSVVLLFRPVK